MYNKFSEFLFCHQEQKRVNLSYYLKGFLVTLALSTFQEIDKRYRSSSMCLSIYCKNDSYTLCWWSKKRCFILSCQKIYFLIISLAYGSLLANLNLIPHWECLLISRTKDFFVIVMCTMCDWNYHTCFGIMCNVFSLFSKTSFLQIQFLTNLNSFYAITFECKQGWNWPCNSWEENI